MFAPSRPSFTRRALAAAVALCCAAPGARAVTITVTSGGDDTSTSLCTLRNAVTAINFGNAVRFPGCAASLSGAFGDNDTVVFAPALAHSTITLAQGQISNYAPLSVIGSGQTLDAHGSSRAFYTIAFLHLSDLTLVNGNSGPLAGGALYAGQASVRLDRVRIASSKSAGAGGGLALVAGAATLTACEVSANQAQGGSGGGGIFASGASVTLTASNVADNGAVCAGYCGGGIALVSGSSLTLGGSTVARNFVTTSGTAAGGGVFAADSKLVAFNATFAGNSAGGSDAMAGAVFERHAASAATQGVTLTNVTVTGNGAGGNAGANAVSGGMTLGVGASAAATLANTVLAANTATRGGGDAPTPDLALAAGAFAASHSLLGSALQARFGGNGNVFADDPGLFALGAHGGATETAPPRGDSPAIDAGSTALAVDAAAQALATDQIGAARVVGASVDIGAVEWPGDPIFADRFGG